MAVGGTRVVQITNIAPQATKDQMQTLFGYLGKIDDIRLYPTIRDVSCPVQSRICYVKFMDAQTVGIAQHMTNTVFIDRALIVIPIQNGEIPDEHKALEMTNNGTIVPGLYPAEPKLPPNVVNSIEGLAPNQVVQTCDPGLVLSGLPNYPPLPVTYDSRKIEEVRRTVVLSGFDCNCEDIISFFATAGEVKYARMCTRNQDETTYALVEFTEQPAIINALKLNGRELKGKLVSVNHATQAIVKPQAKSNEAAQREIEEAMTRVKEAQSLISAAIDPVIGMLSKEKRRRSRSRSRGRRRRSRSRSRSRRRSRSRQHRRSRSKKRSVSRSKRSQSRSKSQPRSKRSQSRTKRSRSRSKRSRSKGRRSSRSRSRSRRRSRSRKSRSKSKPRPGRKGEPTCVKAKESKEKEKKTSGKRSKSRERKRSKSRERKRSRSRNRSRRKSPSPKTSSGSSRKRSRSPKTSRKRDKKEKKETHEKEETGAKVLPRNYDEEEKGFDSEKDADKNGETNRQAAHDENESSQDSGKPEKESSEKSDNMDISNSP